MLADDYPDQDDADNGVCLELGSRVCTPRGRAVYTVHLEVEVVELVEPCVCVCTCVCLESGQPCVYTQRSRWWSWWSLQMSGSILRRGLTSLHLTLVGLIILEVNSDQRFDNDQKYTIDQTTKCEVDS